MSYCSKEVMTSKGSYNFQVQGRDKPPREDTILQDKEGVKPSILAPSFHPRIYKI
jgi:hypothetical protein